MEEIKQYKQNPYDKKVETVVQLLEGQTYDTIKTILDTVMKRFESKYVLLKKS